MAKRKRIRTNFEVRIETAEPIRWEPVLIDGIPNFVNRDEITTEVVGPMRVSRVWFPWPGPAGWFPSPLHRPPIEIPEGCRLSFAPGSIRVRHEAFDLQFDVPPKATPLRFVAKKKGRVRLW